eukprot:3185044-Alexandrium_andersonii.AAC.1
MVTDARNTARPMASPAGGAGCSSTWPSWLDSGIPGASSDSSWRPRTSTPNGPKSFCRSWARRGGGPRNRLW